MKFYVVICAQVSSTHPSEGMCSTESCNGGPSLFGDEFQHVENKTSIPESGEKELAVTSPVHIYSLCCAVKYDLILVDGTTLRDC